MLAKTDAKYFSILHCNIRSLSKNLNLLEELLYSIDTKVDILGITETKLGENSVSNVNINGYNLFHTALQQRRVEPLCISLIILKQYLGLILNLI